MPAPLQAELVAKVAAYDKNFAAHAGDRVHVIIVQKATDPDSRRIATSIQSALGGLPSIGGLPHDEAVVPWSNAAALSAALKQRHAAIVYLASGFAEDAPAIRAALEGVNVLSVGAVADYVPKGIVLGFDLVSGKPKILVHLTQAKKQDVAFKAELLKLARVYE